jgi:protein-glutamine gamma-glutamyltransferase
MISIDSEQMYSDFETELRKAIVDSAIALNASGLRFAVFKNAICNEQFWNRVSNGGWQLRRDVNPADAVRDIFENGEKYATECATAMLIVYYKAILDVYGDALFNSTFGNGGIYLMDWDIRDPLLKQVGRLEPRNGVPLIPGDRAYFSNPDHAPDLPQWQGENVIVLSTEGAGQFYGHGIGITDGNRIIYALNAKRRSDNSANAPLRDAYLLDKVARPDFSKLADVKYSGGATSVWRVFPPAVPVSAVEGKSGTRKFV